MTQSSVISRPMSSPPSGEAAALAQLTPEQRERLTVVLDRYLSALEQDAPLAKDVLLAEHPDLAEALTSYFRSLEDLHGMAAGFGGAPREVEPAPEQEAAGAKRIGDFELIREIGRGGMGVVYEARQISLDRRVAVKLLPFAAVLDAKQIARFKHEAQAAAQLHHPNIVPVFAIGVERGVHYYAMQYIDGQPLDRAIEELRAIPAPRRRGRVRGSGLRVQEGEAEGGSCAAPTVEYSVLSTQYDGRRSIIGQPRPPAADTPTSRMFCQDRAACFHRVAELGVQAAEALDAAHEYGVVHRDIKPSNLLLEGDGKLWVTDFGLARFQRDASLTRTGDIVGTMRYMSPEQAAGQSARIDHRTDIYSLGVTLYELVCLQPAFPEERGPALLKQIDSCEPPRPRQLWPDIPADLETVILKAMSHERDDRYATARHLADDLRCVLEGKATAARPLTAIDRAGRWARRHRRLVATAAAALVVIAAGLSVSTLLISRETLRANRNAADADRRYQGARQMLDQLGGQLAEDLRDVPGADQVRRRLLEQTQQYYLDFINEATADPKLRADAAVTYGKLGSLLAQLGEKDKSVAAHRRAAELLSNLAAADSGDFQTQRLLALAENNLGLALARRGQSAEARQRYDDAIRRQERLLARTPHDHQLGADLASSQCNLGLLQQESHEPLPAAAAFRSAIDRLRGLAEAEPANAELRRKLAAAYNNLASIYVADRPAEAARLHAEALDLLQAIGLPDLSLRHDLALTWNNLGAALSRAGQQEAARAAYERAIAAREELVREAPARASYQIELAASLNNWGMLESRLGHYDAAEATFRRAVVLYETLLGSLAGDSALESNLGGVYNNLGIALERSEQLEAAAAAFASAIDRQRAVCERSPGFPRSQDLLAMHRTNQERVLRKLDRPGAAAAAAIASDQNASLPALNGN